MQDLRDWLQEAGRIGQLYRIDGADWDLEIGCLSALNSQRDDGPALLFDKIKGYPAGFRVLTGCMLTPSTVALTFGLPRALSTRELLEILPQKLGEWGSRLNDFPPHVVSSGPVMENVFSGKEVNLFRFPTPRWHQKDGGRYIGTGNAAITRDPETGQINFGTYRMMISDERTAGLYIHPGKHGRIHYEKHHALGKPCPVAVSFGHHPLVYGVAAINVPWGTEYNYLGAIVEEPVPVIIEEVTGLPIPAESEIVIAGWCPPDREKLEGPFGEWVGYYASKQSLSPMVEVERIYHRNDPIILGSPPDRPLGDSSYYSALMGSAKLYAELSKSGLPGIKAVWQNSVVKSMFITVAIKQMYAGHVKDVALFVAQSRTATTLGRYVVIVDEDIDPTNMQEVLWALCTRSDPAKDIDVVHQTRSGPLDPMVRKPAKAYFGSRAMINACKPYEWKEEFPEEISMSPDLIARVRKKWGQALA